MWLNSLDTPACERAKTTCSARPTRARGPPGRAPRARLREVEADLLRAVDEVRGLAGPLPAQLGNFAARPNQPAERGHLAHDARAVAGVGARRGEGGAATA